MTKEDLAIKLGELDIPSTDDEGLQIHIPPDDRLRVHHRLDTSYYRLDFAREGSSTHPDSRICSPDNAKMQTILKNTGVPYHLFRSAVELLSNSIAAYFDQDKGPKNLKYYPAVILTFWSGFETLLRFLIEKLANTAQELPSPIADFLLENENHIDRSGTVARRARYRPVLDRYSVFLRYAYGLRIDHGAKPWQELVRAQELRDIILI